MTRPFTSHRAPDTISAAPTWHADAACSADPEAMFPDTNAARITYALAVCEGCPVRYECLADALRTGETAHGIRGGLLPEQRKAIAAYQKARA